MLNLLVAVRVSNNNVHFARTMYIMAQEKVKNTKNIIIFISISTCKNLESRLLLF